MRSIVFTGKGGAGASTLAAATAVHMAESGTRTLAFGVGRGLALAFEQPLEGGPRPVAADLWAVEATPGAHDSPGPFLEWLRDLFAWRDMDETVADDVAALPGLVDLACLLELDEHVESGSFDAVVLDLPAIRHSLDLLGALDAATRALDRLLPERAPTMLDPFLRALSSQTSSGEAVYEAGRDILKRLSGLRTALGDPESASTRLVFGGDKGSLEEARRAITALSLYAYSVDAALCNRLTPEEAGPWTQPRREDETKALARARESLQPLPVLPVPLAPRDVTGVEALRALAAQAYGDRDAAAVLHRGAEQAFSRIDGSFVLSLVIPFVEREDLAIERLDDAVIVHVGERSRTFDLPAEVQRTAAVSSAFDGETLRVTFQ
ncbi:MAG: ArsA-related P-loop ATPase [Dehalococcoidia bacterium]